jgi:branched-chain amino acid transport system substrate-binding protein
VNRLKPALAAAVSLSLLAAACGSGGSSGSGSGGDSKAPYEVLIDSGVTGVSASVTDEAVAAVKLQANLLNKDGGINGRQIEVQVLDSGGDPTKAVSQLQDYLSKGTKPDLVYAGVSSPETLALLPALTRQKILSVATTANQKIDNPASYPYHFGAAPTAADQIKTLKAQLTQGHVKNLSVLVPQDAYGDGEVTAVKQIVGPDINVNEFRYNGTDVDYTVAYQRAVANKPDAVFVAAVGVEIGRLMDARAKVGGTAIPTYGDSGMGTKTLLAASPASLENFKIVVFTATLYKDPAQRSQVLQDMIGGLNLATTDETALLYALATDALRSVALAAKQAGSTDPDAMKKAMESLNGPANYWIMQPDGYHYSATEHFPVGTPATYSWITPKELKDGLWAPQA